MDLMHNIEALDTKKWDLEYFGGKHLWDLEYFGGKHLWILEFILNFAL